MSHATFCFALSDISHHTEDTFAFCEGKAINLANIQYIWGKHQLTKWISEKFELKMVKNSTFCVWSKEIKGMKKITKWIN